MKLRRHGRYGSKTISSLVLTILVACDPGPSAYDPVAAWSTGLVTLAPGMAVADTSFLHVRLFETPADPTKELGAPWWSNSDPVAVTPNAFPVAYETSSGLGCAFTLKLRTVAWISKDQASEAPQDQEPFGVTDFVAQNCNLRVDICGCGRADVDVHIDRSSF